MQLHLLDITIWSIQVSHHVDGAHALAMSELCYAADFLGHDSYATMLTYILSWCNLRSVSHIQRYDRPTVSYD